ncbi:MAG: iron-containing alcohol dehydrogenase [Spirochaetes bacterium]|nr:iron-containing alcohol dehydrogenase [Spirochaetota bacterium]
MQSALIVHSRHTREYAEKIAGSYKDVSFLEVKAPPGEEVLKIESHKDVIIGIGGGSVIDTAKIISGKKPCIAIPTTASGAAFTPYATIWKGEKISVPAEKPIVKIPDDLRIDLPRKVRQSTLFDALSHAIESFWSVNATPESIKLSKQAIKILKDYMKEGTDTIELIKGGNMAGEAISITKTNVVHAASYPITIEYGIDHGSVCGMLLPSFISYMDFTDLPVLFDCSDTARLAEFLKNSFESVHIEGFDHETMADKILKYERINHGPKPINRDNLIMILKSVNWTS